MSYRWNIFTGTLDLVNPASPGPSIGGTITGGTDKSVLYIHPDNTIAQDPTRFFYDPSTYTLTVDSPASASQWAEIVCSWSYYSTSIRLTHGSTLEGSGNSFFDTDAGNISIRPNGGPFSNYVTTFSGSDGSIAFKGTTLTTTATELILQETGDTFGSMTLHLQNRTGVNGALFENSSSGAAKGLIDFVFKPDYNTSASQRNIRMEGRSGSFFSEIDEFEIGIPANPSLLITDNYVVTRRALGINVMAPSTAIQIVGTSAQTISQQRNPTSNTAGQNLTLDAGGANTGATNKNGGNLILKSGISTGSGTSDVSIFASPGSAGSTSDNTRIEYITIKGGTGYVGVGVTSPNNTIQVANLINFNNTVTSTFLGYQAGLALPGTGVAGGMTAIGYQALLNDIGTYYGQNVAIGTFAMKANIDGFTSTAIGYNALASSQHDSYNTAIGNNAMFSTNGGAFNVAIGASALYNNTSGSYNIAIGPLTLTASTAGVTLVGIGYGALQNNTTGNFNIGVGASALISNTDGYANSSFAQSLGANVHGIYNSGFGYTCLASSTGSYNSGFGAQSLNQTTGDWNTGFGLGSGYGITGGSYNTMIGAYCGFNAGASSSNIFIGYNCAFYETGSNKLFIDNIARASEADARLKALIYGIFASTVANQRLSINGSVGVAGNATSTSTLNISGLPTSSAGLATGDVWSNSGVLTIV